MLHLAHFHDYSVYFPGKTKNLPDHKVKIFPIFSGGSNEHYDWILDQLSKIFQILVTLVMLKRKLCYESTYRYSEKQLLSISHICRIGVMFFFISRYFHAPFNLDHNKGG